MRSYYYYDHSDGPARKRPQLRRRGGGGCGWRCTCARWPCWWVGRCCCGCGTACGCPICRPGSAVGEGPDRGDGPGPARPAGAAPTGDGTTLAISPLPEGGAPTASSGSIRRTSPQWWASWGRATPSGPTGPGVVMTADGYVITNAHVIADCFSVEVALQSGERLNAPAGGPGHGQRPGGAQGGGEDLVPAVFGDSDTLRCGGHACWPSATLWARSCGAP